MTSVGRHPTLPEAILALCAICRVEADADALNPEAKTFRVVLTFNRADCPNDWIDGEPKPSWLFNTVREHLQRWYEQCTREAQWMSKEEQFGASIDTLMAHWTEELKKNEAVRPENMLTRMNRKLLSNTILRLKELKERRSAGGVYSAAGERRDKASKAWMEDEFEAPKREEQQRRKHAEMNGEFYWSPGSAAGMDEEIRRAAEEMLKSYRSGPYADFFGGPYADQSRHQRSNTAPKYPNKRAWHEVLGVAVNATKEEIKKAHRKLVKQHQPRTSAESEDRSRAEKMMEINCARDEGLEGL